jgi:transposase
MHTESSISYPVLYVGADISKSKVDFYYDFSGKARHQVVDNEVFTLDLYLSTLRTELGAYQVQVILEYTGTYGERLMQCLHQKGIAFSVISPLQSSAFMRSENLTTINDKQAAKALSLFGQQKKPAPYTMPDEAQSQLKQMIAALDKLKEDLQRINNQIHANDFRSPNTQIVTQIWEQRKAEVQAHIKTLEDNINALTKEHFQEMIDNLCSIKGIGKIIATAFVILTQGFISFRSAKQLVKFVGLCPTENSSGSSVRKPKHIPKQGVGLLKALLFNAARSALRSDNVFKRFFDRLKENGKNGKVALTAVMRKILVHIFAIAKSGKKFDPNFQ